VKARGYRPITLLNEEPESTKASKVGTENKDGEERGEPDTKKPRLDTDDTDPSDVARAAVEKFEAELKAANVQVIKRPEDILMDEPDIDADQERDPNTSTWASGGWGDEDYNPSAFTPGGGSASWTASTTNWDPPEVHSLIPLLGPTALPLTHTPGVAEWSVRLLKSFTPPLAPNTLPKSPVETEEDPEAVELELEVRFAKVVLGPWIGWDQARDEMPHLAKPRILESSRGAVVVVVVESEKNMEAASDPAPVPAADGPKPHDPLKDDITILVEPAILEYLSLGMGLGGTWVQIARVQDLAEEGAKKRKKKKKGKSKKAADRYWYVDELLMILPSFYT
jgi:hypothetical protein